MQWSWDGTVNWTAPRRVALAFTPVLAALVLLFVGYLTTALEPREGQEGYDVPVLLFMALMFTAIHAVHLKLINKTLGSHDR